MDMKSKIEEILSKACRNTVTIGEVESGEGEMEIYFDIDDDRGGYGHVYLKQEDGSVLCGFNERYEGNGWEIEVEKEIGEIFDDVMNGGIGMITTYQIQSVHESGDGPSGEEILKVLNDHFEGVKFE